MAALILINMLTICTRTIGRIVRYGGFVTAVFLLTATTVSAQSLCGKRDNFLKYLGENYREAPTAMGLTDHGSVIEVLTSDTGSWTVLITDPDGKTCLVANGEAWETIERLKPGKPS